MKYKMLYIYNKDKTRVRYSVEDESTGTMTPEAIIAEGQALHPQARAIFLTIEGDLGRRFVLRDNPKAV